MNQLMLTFPSSNFSCKNVHPCRDSLFRKTIDLVVAHFAPLKSIAGLLAGKMKAAPLGLDEAKIK
jgi:hypothetical protein